MLDSSQQNIYFGDDILNKISLAAGNILYTNYISFTAAGTAPINLMTSLQEGSSTNLLLGCLGDSKNNMALLLYSEPLSSSISLTRSWFFDFTSVFTSETKCN